MTALIRLLSSTPFRLTLAYMGAFVAAAALIVGFIAWRANDLLTNKVVETLEAEITGLREQFQAGGAERLAAVVAQRSSQPGSSLYMLIDATGRKVAGNLDRVPAEIDGSARGSVFSYARAGPEGQARMSRLAVGVPVAVPGGLILIVGRDIEDLHRFAGSMGQLGLWSIALLSILGIGAGLAVSRSVLRRIETITDASRTIMAGDLSKRIPLNGSGDELDRLSENLNSMLARIEELIGALREVSDNIAHDLKTPLTRLRNRAEAALAHPDGAACYRDGLVKTIEEADELIKTFNSLLLIARLEAGAVAESMGPVDPAAIVADIAELYEPVAEEAGMTLETSVARGLRLVVNRELVSQAVANLVDNAIKYSADERRPRPTDGAGRPTIALSMARAGDAIEISVADRGPGVAPEDRERALQRFVRLEKSRSRPGSGLGLSLVAAVARLHGGSIRLEDNAPGLRAVLTLPLRAGAHEVASTKPAMSLFLAGARQRAQP
ncbi:MAG TPA: ATP-binding protein [Hyphomicrobiaceae bacterium]